MTDNQADRGPVIVWFRQDLRVSDNPALAAAAQSGRPVIPVYILDDETPGDWAPGGASCWWLHHSLATLADALNQRGLRLILRNGRADRVLQALIDDVGPSAVFWSRCYEPWAIERDTAIKSHLKDSAIDCRSFNASLLFEPWTIRTKAGDPYKVFSPFWRACLASEPPPDPIKAPGTTASPAQWPDSDALDAWALLPTKPDWAGGLRAAWTPGEAAAGQRLHQFLDESVTAYKRERDRPDRDSTSRLSPYLHFGNIGPRQVWHATKALDGRPGEGGTDSARQKFLAEIGWREFSYHLLYQFPQLPAEPLQQKFTAFPWRDNSNALRTWQRGQTGFPLVDAGMRQLWETGWMHNRVRMVAASFLIKDLLIPWQQGEAWFWDTLIDADLASNSASWQWVAGCGADAAPYFRIFNPVTQSEKFDPAGAYIRRFVPELKDLPDKWIHKPWEAPDDILASAGIALGETYPLPIVSHAEARKQALQAYDTIK